MSKEAPLTQSVEDPDVVRHPHRTRRLIAAVAAVAVAAGVGVTYKSHDHDRSAPTASSTDHPGKPKVHKPETKPAAGTRRIEDLPGYGQRVTAEQRKALQASTVEVVRIKKDTTDEFSTETLCTGLKVNGGILTARHCLVDGLDAIAEFPNMNSSQDPAHDPSLHNPKIVPERLSGKVSVWTIGANGFPDAQHAIPVDRVAASYYPDLALLWVDKASPNASKYAAVPTISYEAATSGEPVPGAQAVLFNLPELGSKFQETTGTYLGTSANPADSAQQLAWVSVDGSSADKDGCYYKRSGSTSMISGAGVTGPLAYRIQPNDPHELSGESSKRLREYRNTVATDLGVSLEDHNTTLCGFSIVTAPDIDKMAELAATQ